MDNFKTVKKILRYVKGTLHFGLHFSQQSSHNLYGFCDADWAGCPITRRSTSGYCIYLGSNCISWSSKKEPIVARSSSEAEYRAMAVATAEITWIIFLLRDIGVRLHHPPQLFSDNLSALYMTVNPVFHPRSKHIAIDYHFVREKVALGTLITRFIRSSHQIIDIFTKSIVKHSFQLFRRKLGVHSITSNLKKGKEEKEDHSTPTHSAIAPTHSAAPTHSTTL